METPSNVKSGDHLVRNEMCTDMCNTEMSAVHSSVELSLLGFPEKLWNLVTNPNCEEIVWCKDGKCIVIPNTQQFIYNILDNPSKQIFKTKNFTSFIRQLNLYGFRKVTEHRGKGGQNDAASTKCKFKHPFFQVGRRDFLVKVKRQYQSAKKGADKQAALSNVATQSCLHPSRETGVYSTWNPSALYSTAPFYGPVFAQMPMSPLQPTFQFPEVVHGGTKDLNTVGLPCQWDYGPYMSVLPFSTSPLAPERNFKNTRETCPLWSDMQSRTQVNSSSFPELKPQKSRTWTQRPTVFNDSTDSSVAQASFHDDRNNAQETKQPLPAQKSTAELTKSVVQTRVNCVALNAGKQMARGSSEITNEEFHSKKRNLIHEDKHAVFSFSDTITSSVGES